MATAIRFDVNFDNTVRDWSVTLNDTLNTLAGVDGVEEVHYDDENLVKDEFTREALRAALLLDIDTGKTNEAACKAVAAGVSGIAAESVPSINVTKAKRALDKEALRAKQEERLFHRCFDVGAYSVTLSVATEAADVITVSAQVRNYREENVSAVKAMRWYLSDSSDGSSYATSAPNVGVSAGTNGDIKTADDLEGSLVTNASGQVDIDIEHTGAAPAPWYLVIVSCDENIFISDAINHAA